jgi:hypothetical protein
VVHIVCPDDGPGHFLEKVVLFIGTLRRSQKGDSVRPVLLLDFLETRSDGVEGFIPSDLDEFSILLHQGFGQPFTVLDKFVDIPTLDAEPSLTDRVCLARLGTHKLAVQDL